MRNKRMIVTLPNTRLCLHGLLARASLSKRIDGIIRTTDTSEHDYIIPHDAFCGFDARACKLCLDTDTVLI